VANINLSSTKKVLEYYKEADLWLPTLSKFRIFKFVLPSNQVIKLYFRNKEDLRDALLKYRPLSAYYSVSTFLNPKTARGIKEKQLSKRLLLNSDIPIDLDAHDGEFEKAKQDTIKLIKEMKKVGYKRKYIAFSGGGFHVVYKSNIPKIRNPKEREKNLKLERLKIVLHIKSKDISIDEDITLDINRVLRLPNTINIRRGQISKIIHNNNLSCFTIPKRLIADDHNTHLHFKKKGGEKEMGIISPPKTFISNDLYGMNRFVLFLKYTDSLSNVKKDLKKLQEIYNLADIYIFKSINGYYGTCLQTFQKTRLKKIVNASSADKSFIKFNQTWLRIPFSYVCTLKSKRKNIYVSNAHSIFMNKLFNLRIDYPTHGNETLRIIQGV